MASPSLIAEIGVGTPAAPPPAAPTVTMSPQPETPLSPPPPPASSQTSSSPTLDALPREILQQVLSYLDYRDVISCALVSRGMADVYDAPLLWRGLCADEYVSWHAEHCIEERLGKVNILDDGIVRARKRSVLDTDWKQLFASRKTQDREFARAFERVLSRQDGRIDVVAQITSRGEDARDFLERVKMDGERRCYTDFNDHFQRQARSYEGRDDGGVGKAQQDGNEEDDEDDDDDSLARAFWANEMLGSINRAQALREITNVIAAPRRRRQQQQKRQEQEEQQDYPLINALWAIDYFVAESPPETLPQMLKHLDNIAAGFREEYPDCFSTTAAHDASSSPVLQEKRRASYASGTTALPGGRTRRQRALCLAEFVREHDLVGVRSPETYHDLQNSLVSVALCDRDHPSLPLIGHAIYCALAERVGLVAGLTNTPRHVYVTIRAPEGTTLDDEVVDEGEPKDAEGRTSRQRDPATAAETALPDEEPSHGPEDELAPSRTMFLDPFHHEGEVPLAQLRGLYTVGQGGGGGGGVNGLLGFASLLQHSRPDHMPLAGPTAAELAASLAPASTRDMMFRMARNLQETLRGSVHSLAYRTALTDPTDEFVGHLSIPGPNTTRSSSSRGGPSTRATTAIRPTLLNPYRAGYCAWWLQTLLDEIGGLQHRALYNFVEGFMHNFKETDCPLVVEYMLSAFTGGFVSGPGAGGGEDVLGAAAEVGRDEAAFIETVLAHVRREDGRATVAKRRSSRLVAREEKDETETDTGLHNANNDNDETHDAAGTSTPQPQPPAADAPADATYHVGDLFRHRRYRYRAVITGWDATCQASEQWMQQMGVDALPHGRSQSFYHVLVEDHSTRYVAQENIDVIKPPAVSAGAARRRRRGRHEGGRTEGGVGVSGSRGAQENDGGNISEDDNGDGDGNDNGDDGQARQEMVEEDELSRAGPPLDILRIAGRYFKRWDATEGRFVSNVRDEYPDD